MIPLQSLIPERMAELLPPISLTEARKLVASIHRDEPLGTPLQGVRRVSIEAAATKGHVPSLEVLAERASSVDPFRKFVLKTRDGERIETVRIPLEKAGRFSACVSSQAGCALACAFCATGRLGLKRNLEVWEIVEQVRVVRRSLDASQGQRVHGVVFQGMGEPLSNVERVLEAISILSDPSALAIDARAITVCTSGVPSAIRRLAREKPKVRLALSIASARREVRRHLMPIERANPLDEVIDAAEEHAKRTGLAPLWAITPLAGVNDSLDDAHALAELALGFIARTGIRPRISVIPYNRIDDDEADPFRRSSDEATQAFRDALASRGVAPKMRYSGGGDVDAACGQLAGRA